MTRHHKNSNLSMVFQGESGQGIQTVDKIPDDKKHWKSDKEQK